MKKINFLKFLCYLIIIYVICFLKYSENYPKEADSFLYVIHIYQGDSLFQTIIYLLPFMVIFYVIGKKYFYQFNQFSLRYKNRNRFFKHVLFHFFIDSIFFSAFLFLSQSFLLSYMVRIPLKWNSFFFTFLWQYIFENMFMVLLLIVLATIFKNFLYAYLIEIIGILLALMVILPKKEIPFLDLYAKVGINWVTMVGMILMIWILKKIYKRLDVGGVEL